MTANNHLIDDQIIRYLVDPEDLSVDFRFHMESCSHCQAEKNRLERNLFNLGEIAKDFTPELSRRIIFFRGRRKKSHTWNWFRLAIVGMTFTVGVLLAVRLELSHIEQQKRVARLTTEMIKDEHLMAGVEKIDSNDLPQALSEIVGDSEVDLDENLIKMITPES